MGPQRSAAPDPVSGRLLRIPSAAVLASVPISSQLPLIESKLVAPLLPPEITRRSRALDRMSGEERVVLVVAPLGYGKSVIAQQWLDESPRDTVGQLNRFLEALAKQRATLEQQRDDIDMALSEIAAHEEECRRLMAEHGNGKV